MLSRQSQNYLYWGADASRVQHVARNTQIINFFSVSKAFYKRTQGFNVSIKTLALLSLG